MKARSRIFLSTLLLIVFMWPNQKLTASTSRAEVQLSAPVRIGDNIGYDEDPSVMLARDGRFYVVWSSNRQSGVNIYIKSSASRQLYLSWTSSRSNRLGNILLRNLASEQSVYSLLTTERTRDFDAKIAPTKTPGQYLMVWVSDREGAIEIYSRTFHL
jgi:hypothetical protein